MIYLIQLNTPTAQWNDDMVAIFGEKNQGIPVGAPDKKNAIDAFNCAMPPGKRFNPFYLRVTEVSF